MSEPKASATKIDIVSPGLLNWHITDERIGGFRSDAFAAVTKGRSVLIDPLPLEEAALSGLGDVEAICLTGSCHQRSAWSCRKRFGVKVWAPRGAVGLDETPDAWYGAGDTLPGGLSAVHAPGPTEVHYAFHLGSGGGALFCADILVREGGKLRFVSDDHQDDPRRTRETARKLLDLKFTTLCCAHGGALTADPHAAIRAAIASGAPAK